ncbi:hypothetical protein V6N13_124496 [Hibiscus sabdariffa]
MTASPNLSSASIGATGQLNGRSPDDIGLVGTPRVLEHLASPVDLADTRNPKKLKDGVHESAKLGHGSSVNEGRNLGIAGGKNKASVEMKEPSDLWLGLTKFVVNSVSNYLDDLFAQTGDIEALGVHSMDEDDPGDARDTGLRIAWR